jgi:hypothetical protein
MIGGIIVACSNSSDFSSKQFTGRFEVDPNRKIKMQSKNFEKQKRVKTNYKCEDLFVNRKIVFLLKEKNREREREREREKFQDLKI